MKKVIGMCVGVMLGAVSVASASGLNEAITTLCEKHKQCSLQEMSKDQSVTPEQRKSFEEMIDNACKMIVVRFEPPKGQADIISKATACVQSMNELNCDELMSFSDDTPACQAYQEAADKLQ